MLTQGEIARKVFYPPAPVRLAEEFVLLLAEEEKSR
jgi:hypothetical protein